MIGRLLRKRDGNSTEWTIEFHFDTDWLYKLYLTLGSKRFLRAVLSFIWILLSRQEKAPFHSRPVFRADKNKA